VRRPAERVERLTEGQHEVERIVAAFADDRDDRAVLVQRRPGRTEIDSFCVSSGVGAISSLSVSK
jgi:hypothetical protein